jgi:uncharacterized BrkB/YihY/UPF0761 family membrane protein
MQLSREKREVLGLAFCALGIIGCPIVTLLALYQAAFCLWSSATEPDRGLYWGWWFYGCLAVVILSVTVLLWIVIRPLVQNAKKKWLEAAAPD